VPDFALLLRCFRERADFSCNELARAVGVDPSYISRLERAEREPPRRRVVAAIAHALQLAAADQDRLLVSAGYAPAAIAALGQWDPTLQAVAEVLTDPQVPADALEQFRGVVAILAQRWRVVPSAPGSE
jgi:transcriptional regulator with XRE-family HTH domain